MTLQRLEPYFGTQFVLVDLETGEMFAYIRQQWRRAGLYCSNQPFVINDLIPKVECHGQVMWAELEAEQQIPLVDIRRSPRHSEVPPPLPAMDEPAVYILHPDVKLRAVFGHVDQVRDHIDRALQQDDAHCRKRDMRFLILPTRFPRPESMGQGDIAVWMSWICEETDEIMKQLEEERDSRSDPNDPFNGTANGVFLSLQDPLSLPPPVQTPK